MGVEVIKIVAESLGKIEQVFEQFTVFHIEILFDFSKKLGIELVISYQSLNKNKTLSHPGSKLPRA
jgi:hypothetical protein